MPVSTVWLHCTQVNVHEVAMVTRTVVYLLQRGYEPDQLVVPTPYLGQLLEIQKELSKVVKVNFHTFIFCGLFMTTFIFIFMF